MRAIGIESMPHNDHGDDVDVNAKGRRDRRDDAQSAMVLIFGWLAVVIGHGCCGSCTCLFSRRLAALMIIEAERRINTIDHSIEIYDGIDEDI